METYKTLNDAKAAAATQKQNNEITALAKIFEILSPINGKLFIICANPVAARKAIKNGNSRIVNEYDAIAPVRKETKPLTHQQKIMFEDAEPGMTKNDMFGSDCDNSSHHK
jgi:hypothetical protein